MDYLQILLRRAKINLFLILLLSNLLIIGGLWLGHSIFKLPLNIITIFLLLLSILIAAFTGSRYTDYLLQPLVALWQTILHLSPESSGTAPPKAESLSFGQELVAHLSANLYQLVTVADKLKTETAAQLSELSHNFIAQNLPLPLIVLDPNETIKYANQAAVNYIGMPVNELIGKNVYMVLDMSFPSEKTF